MVIGNIDEFICLSEKKSLKQNIVLILPEWTGYRAKGGRTLNWQHTEVTSAGLRG